MTGDRRILILSFVKCHYRDGQKRNHLYLKNPLLGLGMKEPRALSLPIVSIREPKQKLRRQIRKRHLKSEVTLFQILSCLFDHVHMSNAGTFS